MPAPDPSRPSSPSIGDDPFDLPAGSDPVRGRDGSGRLDELRRRLGLDARVAAWAAVALVAAVVAAWMLRPSPVPFEESIPTASSAPMSSVSPGPAADGSTPGGTGSSTSGPPTEIVAHAAGAVSRPGVYRLDSAARVDDLVRAAGGLAADADAARVNLAAPLVDGAQVYFARVGEEAPPQVAGPSVPSQGSPSGGDGAEGFPDGPIDINLATEDELDELPGVGPSIAAAIVAYRTVNGGFSSVEELLDVRGIGEAKLAELTPLVTV